MSEPRVDAVDLSNCDREPIHIPGAIQPHGVLLSFAQPALAIVQISENAGDYLGRSADELLGTPLDAVFDRDGVDQVLALLAESGEGDPQLCTLVTAGRRFDALVHHFAGAAIIELEPAPPGDVTTPTAERVQRILEAIQRAETPEQLCAIATREVRRLSGFDRVMIYRLHADGHGEVIVEERDEDLDPYLGLHYPASDIPQQARALYLRNWLRIIPDARYTPVRLVPELRPDTGAPLDLSYTMLRSVSPIHLEYLANMGLRASMSVTLKEHGRLWGLISCANHRSPRAVAHEQRSVLATLGRLVSLELASFADQHAAAQRAARQPLQVALADAMRDGSPTDDVLATLLQHPAELLGLVGAEGAAVIGHGLLKTCGRTPSASLIDKITAYLDTCDQGAPLAIDSLTTHIASAAAEKDVASGLLAFSLPSTPVRRLVWFRPELVRDVSWGGDPRKPIEPDPAMRIHPRRSFERWKEEVHLRSWPWSASDLEAATELRRTAVELDLGRQVVREQRAVRARDDLVAVVSHDLRSPLGVIQMQASLISTQAAALGDTGQATRLRQGADRIGRAVDRMTALISDLLDLAKIEAGRFEVHAQSEHIRDVVDETLSIVRPLAEAKQISIADDLESALVAADRERIYQVLSNLIGNAIKFTPPGGAITVHAERRGAELVVSVSDTGPGIAPDEIAHVFDRYWQARRADHAGAGLGLYIARGIVQAHGGRMWVESPPGAGAHFYFTLPIVESVGGQVHPAHEQRG